MKRTANTPAGVRASRPATGRERAAFLDINTGFALPTLAKRAGGKAINKLGELSDQQVFEVARQFHQRNHLLRHFVAARRMFVHYGFALQAASGNPKDQKALDDWLRPAAAKARTERKAAAQLLKFVRDAVMEWLLMDVAIAFWMEDQAVTATLLAPEEVRYSDVFNHEILRVNKHFDAKEMKAAGFDAETIKRYTSGEIVLSEKFDEYFAVLKAERAGYGLGRPRIESLFLALEQCGGMEAGEAVLGMVARTVIRQHKLGHAITGARAGSPAHFYKPKRGQAIKDFFRNKQGLLEFTGNFDHDILVSWIDPKLWDPAKWATVVDRLKWWGGAVVNLYLAETLRPYLLGMLKAECYDAREQLKPWLEETLNASFPLPVAVRVSWGSQCFTEPRVADEMLKFLVAQGPLSTTTALEQYGYNPEQEHTRKQAEAALEKTNPGTLKPLFDAAHGDDPAGGGGRPTGTPNPDDA